MRTLRLSSALLLAATVATGCTGLDGFRADASRPFVGSVLGGEDATCSTGASCSFIRRGFSSGTTLSMTYDPALATTTPGTMTTLGETCGQTLDHTPLMAIVPLAHDSLSQYDFPGEGRIENEMFSLQPTSGPLAGRDMMAFVSLLHGSRVEVRLISGSGREPCGPDECDRFARHECDYFGVFNMHHEAVSP